MKRSIAAVRGIGDLNYTGQRVLARFDFNVSTDSNGAFVDAHRIMEALPTIRQIMDGKPAMLTMMSHLGRPKGQDSKFTLAPVAAYLSELLGEKVDFVGDCTLPPQASRWKPGDSTKLVLLENLRYDPREEENDVDFASSLAAHGDVYINDAFGTTHRPHASVSAINSFFPTAAVAAAGLLLRNEVDSLDRILHNPKRPFVAVVGGMSVSHKIRTLKRLSETADRILIGGGMAYPFLKAQGHNVGDSPCRDEDVELARELLHSDRNHGKLLPRQDHVIAQSLEDSSPITTESIEIPDGYQGYDVGPQTRRIFRTCLTGAATVFWNGSMGLCDHDVYGQGTLDMASAISDCRGYSVVGGSDAVNAIKRAGVADKVGHLCTGGRASLEYVANGQLPGVKALERRMVLPVRPEAFTHDSIPKRDGVKSGDDAQAKPEKSASPKSGSPLVVEVMIDGAKYTVKVDDVKLRQHEGGKAVSLSQFAKLDGFSSVFPSASA